MDKKNKQKLTEERKKLHEEFQRAHKELRLPSSFTEDWLIDLIYTAGEKWGDKAHLRVQKEIFNALRRFNEEAVMTITMLAIQYWNLYPHKDMGNQSPFERVAEAQKQTLAPSATDAKQQTKVIVGGHEMTMDEFQEMIKHMEETQKPFRKWLLEEVLPAYTTYLGENYQKKTREKHLTIANMLCERLLHVGFISPEHIRPEFLYVEFPLWWQTHVMYGNYSETTIQNSVIEFISFIKETTGVSMDDEPLVPTNLQNL